MDMGSLRQELQLPHHFITGDTDNDLDEDIMMLGSTPQVNCYVTAILARCGTLTTWLTDHTKHCATVCQTACMHAGND